MQKMFNRANNELFQQLLQQSSAFEVIATPIATSYVVNINESFDHPKQFADIVHVLENASENDHVRINLTTDGGTLASVIPLLGAMEQTMAHVHVHIMSDTASAGTFIVMKADSVSINDYVTFMAHNVSFGSGGQGNIVKDHVEHTIKHSSDLIKDLYKGFFSDYEIEKMLSGKEYYMGKDEFLVRYDKRGKYLQEEYERQLAEAAKINLKPAKKASKPRKKQVDTDVATPDKKASETIFEGLELALDIKDN